MKCLLTISISLFFLNLAFCQQGHFRVKTNEFVQIGYDNYKTLSFGASTGTINNGSWAIEHWNNGLNIWRPWPTYNAVNYALFIRDWDGFTGIGKFPSYKLDVNGDIGIYGTVWLASDNLLKKNINKLDSKNCLELLQQINAYSYNLKYDHLPNQYQDTLGLTETKQKTIEEENNNPQEYNNQNEKLRHGFMAQEIEEILPNLVNTNKEGQKAIDYVGLLPIMLEAIKEQQKEIERLKAQIKTLTK
jgi:hypothetical protein